MALPLAVVALRAGWHVSRTEQSCQVWEPEGRGWPGWSALPRPLPVAPFGPGQRLFHGHGRCSVLSGSGAFQAPLGRGGSGGTAP